MGVKVLGPSIIFGDNLSVVESATIPHYVLHKRHLILSYHRVREAIAAGVVRFLYIPGVLNPADILSKNWGYQKVRTRLKFLMHWEGDTIDYKDEVPK